MDPVALKFRWENPVDGDQWNRDQFGGQCAAVGRILGGQVVARVFERPIEGSTWQKEYCSQVVGHEHEGGKSSTQCAPWAQWGIDAVKTFTEDHLFGALRARIGCRQCGALADVGHTQDEALLRDKQLCFFCHFWFEKISERQKRPSEFAVVDGKLYHVGKETGGPGSFRGFGGQSFRIRWLDGREVATTNLWHNGKVPAVFRGSFPDDAVFVGKDG